MANMAKLERIMKTALGAVSLQPMTVRVENDGETAMLLLNDGQFTIIPATFTQDEPTVAPSRLDGRPIVAYRRCTTDGYELMRGEATSATADTPADWDEAVIGQYRTEWGVAKAAVLALVADQIDELAYVDGMEAIHGVQNGGGMGTSPAAP